MSRDGDTDEGFLSRWSRRKREGEPEETPLATEDAAVVEPVPEADPDETDEEILARLDLPDPDSLSKGDDFSRYLSAAVPERIRRRALRRLWRSNPTLAVLDGLNDYDDDFSGGFVAPGNLKTAYEVGRGIVSQVAELTEPEQNVDRPEADPSKDTPPAVEEVAAESGEMSVAEAVDLSPSDAENDKHMGNIASFQRPVRRRMAFKLPDSE